MSLIAALMSDSVTIERDGPPTRDSTGSEVPGPPVTFVVDGATVMSPYGVTVGSSSEEQNASDIVTTRRVLFAPLGTDVQPADRVFHDGRKYEVIGHPLEFPMTSLAHMEAALEAVTG